ncbi:MULTISPECIES: ATP-binding SpoIIE family protein phosphatase [Streptomyces]|uniref:ATP-binding SpoIIE family protein phosphatase n=1 Tax=Streptomyces pratisoli TaxID=3139917 RepID=A0ACC6QFI5_9ACTN|nr:ATP-binding SpoIIE family protein phosphatase [Streptomyces sp. NBC_00259]
MQQETTHRSVHLLSQRGDARSTARTSLPGNPLAASAARRFVRAALADWTRLGMVTTRGTDRLADDAVLVVSELVTNAVVHAGTNVELLARLDGATEDDPAALVIEVSDHHPTRALRGDGSDPGAVPGEPEYGRGLQLVAALAASWGITYRPGLKTVWSRLPLDGCAAVGAVPGGEAARQRGLRAAEILAPAPRRAVRDDREWTGRGALSFLAEASDLLAGQLDEDMVAALAGQLLVPRLADWCAVWLDGEAGPAPRLARVWHADESAIEGLHDVLLKDPPRLPDEARGGAVPVHVAWPQEGGDGSAVAFRLTVGARSLGLLLLGRESPPGVPDEATALLEDFARRVGLAVGAARQYTRQATISRVLQRGLLPAQVAQIPGVDSSLVYEPSDEGLAGGDFYDIFPAGNGGRWCFMLGDVQGSGPEAAVVTGLARPWLRLLAREGYQVAEVLDRLNGLLLDDAMEAAEAAALMVAGTGIATGAGTGSGASHDGPQSRFLSLLYGELTPLPGGGVRCTLACAGHPLPLVLRPDGTVRPAAASQLLLGVVEDVAYESQTFELKPGDTLLCVTDGVTERRSGQRMFDDADGLARALADCTGLTAQGVADCIRQAVHTFAEAPPDDDLALLVLQAR